MDALAHLFEVAGIQGQVKDILHPDGLDMVNNHFANGSFISMSVKQSLVDGAHTCLHIFGSTLDVVVSDHETNF